MTKPKRYLKKHKELTMSIKSRLFAEKDRLKEELIALDQSSHDTVKKEKGRIKVINELLSKRTRKKEG
jgi:hypothetical protein